jgi:hypothetical protein
MGNYYLYSLLNCSSDSRHIDTTSDHDGKVYQQLQMHGHGGNSDFHVSKSCLYPRDTTRI